MRRITEHEFLAYGIVAWTYSVDGKYIHGLVESGWQVYADNTQALRYELIGIYPHVPTSAVWTRPYSVYVDNRYSGSGGVKVVECSTQAEAENIAQAMQNSVCDNSPVFTYVKEN